MDVGLTCMSKFASEKDKPQKGKNMILRLVSSTPMLGRSHKDMEGIGYSGY